MSRFTVILLAASIATLLGGTSIARAGARVVYEWTDAHGEAHYTDQWVPGAKLIRIETAAAADSGATPGTQSESSAASNQISQEQNAQAVQQDEAKARAAQCTQDKAQYQKLIESRRIYTTDKSGQRHYLSDADADAVRVKTREAMEADCGSGN
ncbi:MAG: hypothetical protein ACRETZ_06615 [Steroidobacteraceae bacterium]